MQLLLHTSMDSTMRDTARQHASVYETQAMELRNRKRWGVLYYHVRKNKKGQGAVAARAKSNTARLAAPTKSQTICVPLENF